MSRLYQSFRNEVKAQNLSSKSIGDSSKDAHSLLKPLYFVLGSLSFVLGVIGAFLPLLPTTPFILLSAFFFSRSSQKVYRWLTQTPVFGEMLRSWNEEGTVSRKAKVSCFIALNIVWWGLIVPRPIPIFAKVLAGLGLLSVLSFVLSRPEGEKSHKEQGNGH